MEGPSRPQGFRLGGALEGLFRAFCRWICCPIFGGDGCSAGPPECGLGGLHPLSSFVGECHFAAWLGRRLIVRGPPTDPKRILRIGDSIRLGPRSALDRYGLEALRDCLPADFGGAAWALPDGLSSGPDEEGWGALLVSWPGGKHFLP
ncbi:hypothetical protein NDU88_004204 [Pleurodeles waltl]|uniref:Uncharacterized protein n=1 Tax=Pleurodeles waltl TaxID=8319 RepID=A0AAV7LHU8_PLEWA|nr:hypothetical protein NDU88_004204 [Pleurodeles waltl]